MNNKLIRFFDILISISVLLFLLPLLLIISFLIYFDDGRPIIFKQLRIGFMGKKFKIFKFRTMKNKILKNENRRLTKIGKIIRRFSLDEIPQFINVLKTEMSIVGPRPLPQNIEKKIKNTIRNKRRFVLPGITGMSQINYTGKHRKLNDKVKLDIQFIDNYSFYNYLKIIIKTPLIIIIRILRNKSSIIR